MGGIDGDSDREGEVLSEIIRQQTRCEEACNGSRSEKASVKSEPFSQESKTELSRIMIEGQL